MNKIKWELTIFKNDPKDINDEFLVDVPSSDNLSDLLENYVKRPFVEIEVNLKFITNEINESVENSFFEEDYITLAYIVETKDRLFNVDYNYNGNYYNEVEIVDTKQRVFPSETENGLFSIPKHFKKELESTIDKWLKKANKGVK